MYTSYNLKIWVYDKDLIQPQSKMLVRREGKFRPMLPFIQRDRFWFLRVFLGTKYQQPAVSHLQEPALLRRTVAKLHEFERTDLQVEASNSVSLQSFDCFVIYSPRYQASPFKLSFTNGISASQSNQILVFFLIALEFGWIWSEGTPGIFGTPRYKNVRDFHGCSIWLVTVVN